MLESLFNKVAGLNAGNVIKKRLQRRSFPVKFAKFFKKNFFTKHLRMRKVVGRRDTLSGLGTNGLSSAVILWYLCHDFDLAK